MATHKHELQKPTPTRVLAPFSQFLQLVMDTPIQRTGCEWFPFRQPSDGPQRGCQLRPKIVTRGTIFKPCHNLVPVRPLTDPRDILTPQHWRFEKCCLELFRQPFTILLSSSRNGSPHLSLGCFTCSQSKTRKASQ